MGLQRHRRLEEPRQCPTGVAPRRYHHTKSQTRTGLGRLGARGSDTRVPRTADVAIRPSRHVPHLTVGVILVSVPLLALLDNLHSRCAAISDNTHTHTTHRSPTRTGPCTLSAVRGAPVVRRGDARVAPPCPTTSCVWRSLPYLTLPRSAPRTTRRKLCASQCSKVLPMLFESNKFHS